MEKIILGRKKIVQFHSKQLFASQNTTYDTSAILKFPKNFARRETSRVEVDKGSRQIFYERIREFIDDVSPRRRNPFIMSGKLAVLSRAQMCYF